MHVACAGLRTSTLRDRSSNRASCLIGCEARQGLLLDRIWARHIVREGLGPGTLIERLGPGTLFETHRQRAATTQFAHESSTKLIRTSVLRQTGPLLARYPRKSKPHHAPVFHTSPIDNTREHKLRVVANRFQMFQAVRAATRRSTPPPFGVARVEVLRARRLLCSRSNSLARHPACSTRIGQTGSDRVANRSPDASLSTNSQSIAPQV